MIRKMIALIVAVFIVAFMSAVGSSTAVATSNEPDCENPTITIHHPEVTHEVEHPAVTHEETNVISPAVWANWAPNDTQGPQDYVPVWPSDDRGTWIVHEQGIPGGHEGPDGVYQQGAGNSPWFYRQAEVTETVTIVDEKAWTETVVDEEAYDEVVENPNYPCEPDTVPDLVEPSYSARLFCPPRGLEIRVEGQLVSVGTGATEAYTYDVDIFRGHVVEFKFTAKKGFIFPGNKTTLSDSVFLPVLRCAAPQPPTTPDEPTVTPDEPNKPQEPKCPDTHKVPVKHDKPKADAPVPTNVDAGLAPVAAEQARTESHSWVLVFASLLTLFATIATVVVLRRNRS